MQFKPSRKRNIYIPKYTFFHWDVYSFYNTSTPLPRKVNKSVKCNEFKTLISIWNVIHDDRLKLSLYLFACTQADVSSRYQILETVNTNLSEQRTYELSVAISGLQQTIMKFALDVCPAVLWAGWRWISVKF